MTAVASSLGGPSVPRRFPGVVVRGDARARELGFPTANVGLPAGAGRPAFGVYAGRVDGRPAAISIGVRPTFDDGLSPLVEAHILDFSGDLYGREVEIELLAFVRDEQRFADVSALLAQVRSDVRAVRSVLDVDQGSTSTHSDVLDAVEHLRRGGTVVVYDGAEASASHAVGHFVVAAKRCHADHVNLMAREARGLVCLALSPERCDRLDLQPMRTGESATEQAFTVSIEARDGVTTGISTADRARTVQAATAPGASARDLVVPGHVFPLRARSGGVLARAGVPEAAVDLARLAGCGEAAVTCAVLDDAGDVADREELAHLAERLLLPIVTVAELVAFRTENDPGLGPAVEISLPAGLEDVGGAAHRELGTGRRHLALWRGDVAGADAMLRVHRQHMLDTLSARPSAGPVPLALLAATAPPAAVLVLVVESDDASSDGATAPSRRDLLVVRRLLERTRTATLRSAPGDAVAARALLDGAGDPP